MEHKNNRENEETKNLTDKLLPRLTKIKTKENKTKYLITKVRNKKMTSPPMPEKLKGL